MTQSESKPVLMPNRFQIGEYLRNIFVAVAEQGVQREHLLRPEYWAHIAAQTKPWDRIDVLSDDGTFYGEYMVLSCGRNWLKVRELRFVNLTTSDVSQTEASEKDTPVNLVSTDQYTVKYRGPVMKWSVINKSNKEVMKSGFNDESEAHTALVEFVNQMKVPA